MRKVESSGGRFLEKADDGLWYQMDGVKARKKASGGKPYFSCLHVAWGRITNLRSSPRDKVVIN